MEVTKVPMVVDTAVTADTDMVESDMAGMVMNMRVMSTATMGIMPDIIVNGTTTMPANMEDMAGTTWADMAVVRKSFFTLDFISFISF